ncbi:MAG TPA: hypothetical protein VF411_05040 [Bacteroidia bacterium]
MATLKGENAPIILVLSTPFKEVKNRLQDTLIKSMKLNARITLSLKRMVINPASG